MTDAAWKPSLQAFFETRAHTASKRPSVTELCFIAGREARLWSDSVVYDDLITSIVDQCAIDRSSSVLEVGCAAGFLARGIAPRAGRYHGVDLAPQAVRVARRLGLRNATFSVADGARLKFAGDRFDAAFCYDVFTNFPDFTVGAALICEMFRVVRPGARVLVGSIPDGATRARFEAKVAEVGRELDARYGPPQPLPSIVPHLSWRDRVAGVLTRRTSDATPQITTYYFNRSDFEQLGRDLGVEAELVDIHRLHPYHGFRFNAIYRKPL